MCVAYPGKVIACRGHYAQVDFQGVQVKVNLALAPAHPGDYVLVHAGMAIQVLQPGEAQDLEDLYEEIEEEINGTQPAGGVSKNL